MSHSCAPSAATIPLAVLPCLAAAEGAGGYSRRRGPDGAAAYRDGPPTGTGRRRHRAGRESPAAAPWGASDGDMPAGVRDT